MMGGHFVQPFMWRSGDNLLESILPFLCVCGSQGSNSDPPPLSHLESPRCSQFRNRCHASLCPTWQARGRQRQVERLHSSWSLRLPAAAGLWPHQAPGIHCSWWKESGIVGGQTHNWPYHLTSFLLALKMESLSGCFPVHPSSLGNRCLRL